MATLGYAGPLYILAFDHRGSFQKKMFGIEGDPTPEETETIADAKRLIFEGMLKSIKQGAEAGATGVLVDEQFGSDVPSQAREHGLKLAMPVEKSGQDEFDFQYGDEFGAHIESFDPDFAKVLVRYNPEDDADKNERQLERLKRLADWLHDSDRKFLFELLVPATDEQLSAVDGDTDRYDAELRPELMRRSIEEVQNPESRSTCGRSRASTSSPTRRSWPSRHGPVPVARRSRASCSVAARRPRRSSSGCSRPRRLTASSVRDRTVDLVGRAQGVSRRRARSRRCGVADRRELPALRRVYEQRAVH